MARRTHARARTARALPSSGLALALACALAGCGALEDEPRTAQGSPGPADPPGTTPGEAPAAPPEPTAAERPGDEAVRATGPQGPAAMPAPDAPGGGSIVPPADPEALTTPETPIVPGTEHPAASAPTPVDPDAPARSPGVGTAADAAADAAVDCAGSLPCTLRSPDGGFEVRLSRAAAERVDGTDALVVDFAIGALSRDAAPGVDGASSAAWAGERTAAAAVRVGADRAGADGYAGRAIAAGTTTDGTLRFAGPRGATPDGIDRLELVVREAGAVSRFAFAHVPLGPLATPPVDCALALPCTWRSPNGELALEIDAVGTDRWHHSTRTAIDWRLVAARPFEAELADAALALTDTGHEMEYYGIDFGGTTSRGEGPLDDTAAPGASVPGRTVFRRAAPADATALARLEIAIAERAVPRVRGRRIVFERLPIAR